MSTPRIGRKTRADSERNRDRVLDAARTLFAEAGYNVQMSEVARVAGVGVGTVYRKFPTREALIEAIAEQRSVEMIGAARRFAEADDSADQGLRGFLHYVGEVLAADRGMSEVIEKAVGSNEPRGQTHEALLAGMAELIDRARVHEAVGQEVTTADIDMVICGLAAVIRNGAGEWRRYVEIALDGLRGR